MDARVPDGKDGVGDNVAGFAAGQLLEGRYRLVRRIATGGMATVYVAEHTRIGRLVAIKVLHEQYADDAECVRRFLDEGRTVGTLGHPHIVESTDMGYTATGAPYLVLELLEGRNLEQEIRGKGPLPVLRAVRIAQQIASALAAAHSRGIIHRDLKSGNVFLVNRADGDHVKVLDFGISKFMEGRGHTQKGKLLGTPWFMSPEQINDPASVDARCDVYSLGVILYEMLAGQVPFHDAPFPVVFAKILSDEPPPLRSLRPNVSPELAAVVASAMAKTPAQRMQSMEEFSRALDTIVGPYWLEMRARARSQSDFEVGGELLAAGTPMPVLLDSDGSPRPVAPAPIESPAVRPKRAMNDDAPTVARVKSRVKTVPPPPPRGRAIAGIAFLVVAFAVAAIFLVPGLLPTRDRPESPAKVTELEPGRPLEASPRSARASEPRPRAEATGPSGGEVAVGQPSGELPPTGTPTAPAADMVHLTIRASARGAHATFRGETYRLPMRAELERGNGPEPVEISAPDHIPTAISVTLDQDRKVTVDLERTRRASNTSAAEGSIARHKASARSRPAADAPPGSESEGDASTAPSGSEPETSEPAEKPVERALVAPEPSARDASEPPARKAPVPGTIDRDALRKAVARQRHEVLTCFERGRMDNAQLAGIVVVRIRVDPSGKVRSAKIAQSTLGARSVDLCIASAIETWTLIPPAGGVSATFDYRFPFNK